MMGGAGKILCPRIIQLCILQRHAHLKNFALPETESGDYFSQHCLRPYQYQHTLWYDTDFALNKDLFVDDFQSPAFKKTHRRNRKDFMEFARRIGIDENG